MVKNIFNASQLVPGQFLNKEINSKGGGGDQL